ncbi:MAG: glycosylase [Aeromicrobium sp.]|nr:glycosylase [Aeromicrobium sp.]
MHLGLYGSWVVGPMRPVVGQVRWRVATSDAAADLRGPTVCELINPGAVEALLARLGPDPLRADADPERAWQRIRTSRTPVAALLMDQRVLAGVGNVYRAEVLFRRRVDPDTPGRELNPAVWSAIWADLIALMRTGERTGRIDTVLPEHEPEAMGREPRVDDHGGEVYIYRRAELPCLVCSTPIRRRVLAGRNLFWCPTCQQGR